MTYSRTLQIKYAMHVDWTAILAADTKSAISFLQGPPRYMGFSLNNLVVLFKSSEKSNNLIPNFTHG